MTARDIESFSTEPFVVVFYRDHEGKHALITKTEAKEVWNVYRHVMRVNSNKSILYVCITCLSVLGKNQTLAKS